MKHANKFLALILALAMVLSLGITAFAAETAASHKITRPDNDTHTYAIYQIFKGDLSGDTLSNIKAGHNFNGDDDAAVEEAKALADMTGKSEKEIATYVNGLRNDANPKYTIDGDTTEVDVEDGYYIIIDTTDPIEETGEKNLYVVNVAGDFAITRKRSETTSQKKVKDVNDTTGAETDWQDTADYDIGDEVPFRLTATLTGNLDEYDTYKLTFHDNMCEALSLNEDSIEVYVDGEKISTGYEVKTDIEHCTFEVHFDDVKIVGAKAGSTVTVYYNATLNENGVVYGNPGNPNTMHITYSNNPYDENGGENGKTPDDTVVVFTYKTIVNKVDPAGDALEGAEFTLYKKLPNGGEKEIKTVAIANDKDGKENVFEFKGLDDGDYVLKETVTPAGYNTMADLDFTIEANHVVNSDIPADLKITDLKGGDTFTGNVDAGTLTGDIKNEKGTVLPSTGGIGTTIFYVVGSMMMLAAAVLLITRKKMSAYQD